MVSNGRTDRWQIHIRKWEVGLLQCELAEVQHRRYHEYSIQINNYQSLSCLILRRGSMVQLGWLGTLLSKLRYRHADSRSWAHYKRTNLWKSDADRKLSRLGQLFASVIRHRALPRFEKWLTSEYSLLNDIFSWRFMVKLGSVGDMLYQLWSRCTISLTYTQWWHTVLREFNRHRKLSRWGLPWKNYWSVHFCLSMLSLAEGSWSNWGVWGACSTSSGPGTKSRLRAHSDGTPCTGSPTETEGCQGEICHAISFSHLGTLFYTNELQYQLLHIRICHQFWDQ